MCTKEGQGNSVRPQYQGESDLQCKRYELSMALKRVKNAVNIISALLSITHCLRLHCTLKFEIFTIKIILIVLKRFRQYLVNQF